MSKIHEIKTSSIEAEVMKKIKSGKISMKPRWYFVVGAFLSVVGLASFGIAAIFLSNLTIFLLKQHGPNSQYRLQQILESFPIWVPVLAITGIVLGIWMLKKYDFSYKKNFGVIAFMFVISIILTAFLLNATGLDNIWMKRGPMMRFYQNHGYQQKVNPNRPGQVKGKMIDRQHSTSPF